MISHFRDKALEALYYHGPCRAALGIPQDLHRSVIRRLTYLAEATDLNDLRVPPANRLEKLAGDLAGRNSIRVNDQYRIVFRWSGREAFDVELIDYHR